MTVSQEHLKKDIRKLEAFASVMDSQWRLPFTHIYLGYDALIGLVPIFGDVFTALASCWLIKQASKYNLSGWVYVKMATNILIDLLLGLIPVVGDFLDILYRGNKRNVALIKSELEQISPESFT